MLPSEFDWEKHATLFEAQKPAINHAQVGQGGGGDEVEGHNSHQEIPVSRTFS